MTSKEALAAVSAITLELLRLSVDLIQIASSQPTTSSQDNNSSSNSSTTGRSSTNQNHHYHHHKTDLPPPTETDEKKALPQNHGHNHNANYGSVTDESKSLLSSSSPDEENLVAAVSTSIESSSNHNTNNNGKRRFLLFISGWVISAVFLVGTILFSIEATSTQKLWLIDPMPLVLATVIIIVIEIVCHCLDPEKLRYGAFRRLLRLAALLILWTALLIPLIRSHQLWNPTSWFSPRVLVLLDVTVLLVLALADSWLAHQYPTPARRRSQADATRTPTLSRSALLTLVKPYVWPDATNETALWNRARAIATWLCVIMSKVCNLVSPMILGRAATALAHQDYTSTIRFACLYSLISWLGSTFKEGQFLFYLKVGQAAFVQLSEAAFDHLHHLSLDWHLRKKLGEVLRSMDRGITACDTLMNFLFLRLVPTLAECVLVTVIFALYFQYLPLAVNVFYFAFVYIVWTILLTLWRKKFRKALVKHDNEWHDLFTDSMVNFETVKHFTSEDFELKRFRNAVSRYQVGSVHVQGSLSVLNVSQKLLFQTCMASSLALAVWGIEQRGTCCTETVGCESSISDCCRNVPNNVCPGMQVGDFVTVLTYLVNLFAPLDFLGTVYNAVVMAMVDLGNLSELLAENPDVVDAQGAVDLPRTNVHNPETAIEFDNVHFHYPTQPRHNGLRGLSFTMKQGSTTAIVGPTGAGKTTIGRLLFRFYDVLDGAVRINGVDVRSVTQKSLRQAIGVVPQTASMFNDTLRFNLMYGRRDATDQELREAAKNAQLLDFIDSLDNGWETVVGDRGLKLSGGEKQRAGIARCLLKDPPFVLLDEATSSLDTLTENSVQEALDRLGQQRTVLVIAHRLSTIRNADKIIVVKEGRVAEEGTHNELLAANGIYAEMWNVQLSDSTLG